MKDSVRIQTILPLLNIFNGVPDTESSSSNDSPKITKSDHKTLQKSDQQHLESADFSKSRQIYTPAAFTSDIKTRNVAILSPEVESTKIAAVVLASASPARKDICKNILGLNVTCIPSSYEDSIKNKLPLLKTAEIGDKQRGGAGVESPSIAATPIRAKTCAVPHVEGLQKQNEEGNGHRQGQISQKQKENTEEESRGEPELSNEDLLKLLQDDAETSIDNGTKCDALKEENRVSLVKLYALRMAVGKAGSVAKSLWAGEKSSSSDNDSKPRVPAVTDAERKHGLPLLPASVVIGADTIIEYNGCILEKPADEAEASSMLSSICGNTHCVHTAVCIFSRRLGLQKPAAAAVCSTNVTFARLSKEDLEAYLQSKQYVNRSGSYGIHEYAGQFLKRIDGSFTNVMGLPAQWVSHTLATLWQEGKIL